MFVKQLLNEQTLNRSIYTHKVIILNDLEAFEKWNNKGIDLAENNKYKDAIVCYNKAIKINSRYFDAWFNKGICLLKLSKFEEAISCYDEALKINPKEEDLWNNKGAALRGLRKYAEAIKCFDKEIQLHPKNIKAWNNKGVVLGELKKYKEVVKCSEESLKFNSKNVDAWINKGNALDSLKKYGQALKCYNKAISLDSKNYKSWNNKGLILGKLQKYTEAIYCFDNAISIDAEQSAAQENKLYALEELKRNVKRKNNPSTFKEKLRKIFNNDTWEMVGTVEFIKVGSLIQLSKNEIFTYGDYGIFEKNGKIYQRQGNFKGQLCINEEDIPKHMIYYKEESMDFFVASDYEHNPLPDEIVAWIKELKQNLHLKSNQEFSKKYGQYRYRVVLPEITVYKKISED